MPIYEYACESCEGRFEVQQKISDPPLTACPKCGRAVHKLISSPAIMFKGSGWYVTDYSDKLKPPASAEAGDGKAPAETKPAAAAKAPEGGNGASAASSSTSSGGSTGTAPPATTPSSSSSGTGGSS